MKNVLASYIPILNPGKCGSSWLANALSIPPNIAFLREFDFIFFLEYDIKKQWNLDTVQNKTYLRTRNDPSLTKDEKLLALYAAERKIYPEDLLLIDKAPSNVYAGFDQYRHLFRKSHILFLYRDPRDIYISGEIYQQDVIRSKPKIEEIGSLEYLRQNEILDGSFLVSQQVYKLEQTLRAEGYSILRLTYEQLKQEFNATILKILDFLPVQIDSNSNVESTYNSHTVPLSEHIREAEDFRPLFRKGIIGDWKNHIQDDDAIAWICDTYGEILAELGYED